MNLRSGLMIAIALLTAGCSIFPEYLKPTVKAPENWQANLPHTGNLNQLEDWWGQFNDPALNQLLHAAQIDSPTLDIALANIKSARANSASASAQNFPSLAGSISASRAKGGTSGSVTGGNAIGGTSGVTETIIGKLDASWEIDLFGGIKFSKQAADARLEAKRNDWHTARVSLAAEVATNYVEYRACEQYVAEYQQTLASKSETLRLTNILAKAGFSAPADSALAEASSRATESNLIAQQAQCDNTVKSLVALTNLPETNLRKLLSTSKNLPQPKEFNVSTLPADLISQRPDLIVSERNLAAVSADIGVATANLYPSLTLSGSIGRRNASESGISIGSNTWSFGPSITLPIFDGGRTKAQVSIAEANYAIALATYQQSVRDAVKEVEQVLVNLDGSARRETTERISTEQYRKYYHAAEINWRAGGINLITLEDARRQMINAELSLISQQRDRVQYWIALYKALGGGWQAGSIPDDGASKAVKDKAVSIVDTTNNNNTKADNSNDRL
jgi:NodT family efflux transporter outer membrane factor (OMF) lipoprotein